MLTVLYICTDSYKLAGSSLSLLNMISSVKEEVYPIILISGEGEVADCFRNKGYEVIVRRFFMCWKKKYSLSDYIKHPRGSDLYRYIVWDLSCTSYVKSLLAGRRIDIVHTNTSITYIGWRLSKALNARLVWHIREYLDLDFDSEPFPGRNFLRNRINRADYRICITNSVANHWQFKKKNTSVLYNAIIKDESFRIKYEKNKYFLFCSAVLMKNKGVYSAVKCFCESGVNNYGYQLKLVGSCGNETRSKIIEIADKYRAADSIVFLGSMPDPSEVFSCATGFLMCSKNEALGRVTVEAMYYGCPVIGKDSGGTSEIIEEGVTGFKYCTEEECSSVIKYVAFNDMHVIIDAAYKYAVDHFTEKKFKPRLLSIYKSLVYFSIACICY